MLENYVRRSQNRMCWWNH